MKPGSFLTSWVTRPLLAWLFVLGTGCCPSAEATQHEVQTEIQWISQDLTSDRYVINGDAFPSISAHVSHDYPTLTSRYTYFFTPLPDDDTVPIDLQRFLTHPTTLRVSFSAQPETEATSVFRNAAQGYFNSTSDHIRSRSAEAQLTYYVCDHTGLLLQAASLKEEISSASSNSLDEYGRGDENDIRRSYEVGFSHYLSPHLKLNLTYTRRDGENISVETLWDADAPLLFQEHGRKTESEGNHYRLEAEYVVKHIAKIAGFYEFSSSDSHSNTSVTYYGNFPGLDSYYTDDGTHHTFGLSTTFYVGHRTTLHAGGQLAYQDLQRTYQTDQNVDYEWDVLALTAGMGHYLNQHFGVWIGYEFLHRDGDVVSWHPQTDSDLHTVFHTDSDIHTLCLQFTGRW